MKRRLLFFLLFFPALLLPSFVFLASVLTGLSWWLLPLSLPFLSVLSFPMLVMIRGRSRTRFEALLTQAAYFNMGFLSFLLLAALGGQLLRWLAHVPVHPLTIVAAAVLAFAVAAWRGIFAPSVKTVRLAVPGLGAELEGLRIAQVSDLHISAGLRRRYVERVVKHVRQLDPHLVALTGDIGDGRVHDHAPELEALAELTRGGAPVYYVPGNHEAYWDADAWLTAFREAGMKVLENRGERFRHGDSEIHVAGISDPMFEMLGAHRAPDLAAALRGGEDAAFRLLLSHRPHFADAAAAAGVQLQLSGHTHGGQFVPWTFVAALVHRYVRGAYRVGEMWIYVNAGTGSWGPRLRLGTTAEVTLIELTREARGREGENSLPTEAGPPGGA